MSKNTLYQFISETIDRNMPEPNLPFGIGRKKHRARVQQIKDDLYEKMEGVGRSYHNIAIKSFKQACKDSVCTDQKGNRKKASWQDINSVVIPFVP